MLRSKHLLPISLTSLTVILTLLNGSSVAFAELFYPNDSIEMLPLEEPAASPSPSPAPSPSPPLSPSARSSAGIQFSSEVPNAQFEELAQDLADLPSVPITQPDSKLLSVMGLKDVSPQSLMKWLTERVHYVVDQNYNVEPQQVQTDYTFPNSGIVPVLFGGTDATSSMGEGDDSNIFMGNLGSSYYQIAKSHTLLVSVYVQGVGDVTLTSPRVGILKIGPALFDDSQLGASTDPQLRNARRALQLAVMFHEARHSDGHAAHLGFNHMICPPEHELAGLPACDANLNGPYSIQAHLLNSFDRSCEQCSLREHEILKMAALNNIGRVQKEVVDPTKDPVAVLRQTELLSSLCDGVSDMGLQNYIQDDLAKDCAALPKQLQLALQIKQGKYTVPTIQSTDWDPAPEGSFNPQTDVRQ